MKDVLYRVVLYFEMKFVVIVVVDESGEEYLVLSEEASAYVLRTLLDAAEVELGMMIDKVVIMVLVYFDDL